MPILAPLIILSLASIYSLRSTTCTFDKTLGTITIEHQGLKTFWNENLLKKTIQKSIEQIDKIELEAFPGSDRYWNIVAVLKNGERLPLIWMVSPGKEEKQVVAKRIQQFLDLPNE